MESHNSVEPIGLRNTLIRPWACMDSLPEYKTESINLLIRINVLAYNLRLTAVVWSDAISALSRGNNVINVNETQCA